MIKSFRCKHTQSLFNRRLHRRWSGDVCRKGLMKLLMLHACTQIESLKVPLSNRLEKLKGDRAGYYSIRVNDQWRVCFRWNSGNAYDVEIVDYH